MLDNGSMLDGLEKVSIPLPSVPHLVARQMLDNCLDNAKSEKGQANNPYGDAPGMRILPGSFGGKGLFEAVCVQDGVLLVIHDRHFEREYVSTAEVGGWISLHFRLTGSSTHVFGDIGQVHRGGHSCMLVAYPDGVFNCERFEARTNLQSVGLAFEPEFLVSELGLSSANLPDVLKSWLEGDRSEFYRAEFPFTGDMHQAVSDLIDCRYTGRLRYKHAQARSLQLLCMIADALARRSHDGGVEIRLTTKERQRLREICDYLATSFEDSITIAALAQRAGMNRTKLQYGFRHMFGTTINEYRSEARMARAHELLRKGDLTIGQVARAVGYDHANNFTAAFKRKFGFLPREDRRQPERVDSLGS